MSVKQEAVAAADLEALRTRLDAVSLLDRRRLLRRLEGAPERQRRGQPRGKGDARAQQPPTRQGPPTGETLAQLVRDVADAEARVRRRRAAVPDISFPPQLPVSQAIGELGEAIRAHQVVVVAGETGSGKTTQLPKLLLELGCGVRGLVGHTQPRRIAARTVAERIAEELGVGLGEQVGYAVRFTDRVGDATLVKLMTDGILLAEVQRDRDLLAYDALVIDEAHERSLNVDFLLGYLARLLPRRPGLKVVVTSATIDPGRFARHFAAALGVDVPVLEVSGRTFPVEVRYQPVVDPDAPDAADRDQTTAVVDAVRELTRESPGDVLVFLSGEREIRDTADALRGAQLAGTEVVPLYARLSAAEQHRVFEAHSQRRVVLATNVAETSLTVPGIRYVVDPGTARISRWSRRTRVQRLPIEKVSQASARQRAGRCGRVADGICVRLYAEEDFLSRPEFTDPEILRTDLAAIVLRMAALGLGDVEAFPFLDPPDRRDIRDARALLHELGAIESPDGDTRLTPLGRRLARLPVDPRLGRMLLESDRLGCVREVLVVVAALAIQDPRERPADKAQAAAEAHARFADETSDFLGWLNLWEHLREQQRALSSSAFRRMCSREFLHYQRVREWQDLHGQLRGILGEIGVGDASAPDPDLVHQALLAGLLSHVGLRDERKGDYQGARGARFVVSRDSALARRTPRWVVAAELVETARLFARTVARVEPEWVEGLAAHLVARSYSEPAWDRRRGSVVAVERVTLYGVPLVVGRRVAFGSIDPVLSRELFLQHALVEGDWDTRHHFWRDNQALLAEVEVAAQRTRRVGGVSDRQLFAFYDARVPADVFSGRHFDAWWKTERHVHPDLLTLRREDLLEAEPAAEEFPDAWDVDGARLPLSYVFEPGTTDDGVTVHVPLALLPAVGPGLEWLVPGLREELVTALLRGLPKELRRRLGPAPDLARAVLPVLHPADGALLPVLSRAVLRETGVEVPYDAWQAHALPAHLRPTVRVEDAGRVLGEGKDVGELRRRLAPAVRSTVAAAADDLERRGLRTWPSDVEELPRGVERRAGAHVVTGWPALVDEGETAAVRVFATAADQAAAMPQGTRRLLRLALPSPAKALRGWVDPRRALLLASAPHAGLPALFEDCVTCALDDLVARAGGPVWTASGFAALLDAVRPDLERASRDVLRSVEAVLAAAAELRRTLAALTAPAAAGAVADVREQLAALLPPGFATTTTRGRLADLQRYLQAAQRRLERLPADAARDRVAQGRVEAVLADWERAVARLPPGGPLPPELADLRWAGEELRVSLWAQQLGTKGPVSEQRIARALAAATA